MLALEGFPKVLIMKPPLLTGFSFGRDFPLGGVGRSAYIAASVWEIIIGDSPKDAINSWKNVQGGVSLI